MCQLYVCPTVCPAHCARRTTSPMDSLSPTDLPPYPPCTYSPPEVPTLQRPAPPSSSPPRVPDL